MNKRPVYAVVPMLYAAALVASIFAGGFVAVAIVGAILTAAVFTFIGAQNGTLRNRRRRSG